MILVSYLDLWHAKVKNLEMWNPSTKYLKLVSIFFFSNNSRINLTAMLTIYVCVCTGHHYMKDSFDLHFLLEHLLPSFHASDISKFNLVQSIQAQVQ